MIMIKSNAIVISNTLKKISIQARKGWINSIEQTAAIAVQVAKSLAPSKTGTLKDGIYSRVFKDKAQIISTVPTAFKYNLWVNQTPPFRILRFRKRNKYFFVPQNIVYGNEAISVSGRPVIWTGMPNYMDVTYKVVNSHLIKSINNAIAGALRTRG